MDTPSVHFQKTVAFPVKPSAITEPQKMPPPEPQHAGLEELLSRLTPLKKEEQQWYLTRFAEKYQQLPFDQSQSLYEALIDKIDSTDIAVTKAGKKSEPSMRLLMDVYNALGLIHDQKMIQHFQQGKAAPQLPLVQN